MATALAGMPQPSGSVPMLPTASSAVVVDPAFALAEIAVGVTWMIGLPTVSSAFADAV